MAEMKKRSRHFTSVEKEIFKEILKKYSAVIENKKSDAVSAKEKEEKWNKIAEEFNSSIHIVQHRDSRQLRKLWANMKCQQREVLTKERQALMTTGGGPRIILETIDPVVAEIAPHLMIQVQGAVDSDMMPTELEALLPQEVEVISTAASSQDLSPPIAGPSNSTGASLTAIDEEAISPTPQLPTSQMSTVRKRKQKNEYYREKTDELYELKLKKAKLEVEAAEIMLRVSKKKEQLIDIKLKNSNG